MSHDPTPRPQPDPNADPQRTALHTPKPNLDGVIEALLHPSESPGVVAGPLSSEATTPGTVLASARGESPIPGYEIEEELGRGGMGIVYRARDIRLNREVALKMILRADTNRIAVARFWAEAEVMAAVKHPHVVQVFELGEHDRRPFMAMELVTGGSLADRIKATGAFRPNDAAMLVEKIARGVAAAHDLGIVHRDLKPGNVLLAVDNSPKVTDFGLAKRAANDLTASQAVMGTPAYMAPEQAAGRAKFVGPPADVWALGVILYECLTAKRPFQGDTVATLLSQIQSAEPPSLRSVVRAVPRDLEVIVSKCLAKESEHRYPTASELADDLGSFVRGESISARPVGQLERFTRWVRRKPTAAAAYGFSGLAVLLAVVSLVIFNFWREAERAKSQETELRKTADVAKEAAVAQREIADKAKGEAERLRDIAEHLRKGEETAKKEVERQKEVVARINYARTLKLAEEAYKRNDLSEARNLLTSTQKELRGWEFGYLHRIYFPAAVTFEGHRAPVFTAVWNPSGSKVLTASVDGTARIWDGATGRVLHELTGQPGPDHVAVAWWSPDGSKVVTARGTQTLLWDATTGKTIDILQKPEGVVFLPPVHFASWSPNGTKFLTVSIDGIGRVWGAAKGQFLHELVLPGAKEGPFRPPEVPFENPPRSPPKQPHLIGWWSPDGSKVLMINGISRIWNAGTGQLVHELRTPGPKGGAPILSLTGSWNPDGSKVVTGGVDGTARIWDAATGKQLHELKGHNGPVWAVAWHPDGGRVATARDGARIWDTATGKQLHELKGFQGEVIRDVSWDPVGLNLATNGFQVQIWNAATGVAYPHPPGPPPARYLNASWNTDGSKILMVSTDNTVRVWNATRREWNQDALRDISVFRGHVAPITSASWSRDGSKILTASADMTAQIWDPTPEHRPNFLENDDEFGRNAFLSPDASKLLAIRIHNRPQAQILNVSTGKLITHLTGLADPVGTVKWSPDGSKVLVGRDPSLARVWDTVTGAPLALLNDLARSPSVTWWAPDGSKLLTAQADQTGKIWDARTGKLVTELIGLKTASYSALWSPDSSKVVTVEGGLARVWDATTGMRLRELFGHRQNGHTATSWSPDGTKFLMGNFDGTAHVWDVHTGRTLHELIGHTDPVAFAYWNPSGSRVLTVGRNELTGATEIRGWNASTGEAISAFRTRISSERPILWTLDGSRLVAACQDVTIRLWDIESGEELLALPGIENTRTVPSANHHISLSKDGAQLRVVGGRHFVIYNSRPANRSMLADINTTKEGGVKVWGGVPEPQDTQAVKDVPVPVVVPPKLVKKIEVPPPPPLKKPDLLPAQTHAARGLALAQKGDIDGAIGAFREAIKQHPENVTYHNQLRHYLDGKQDWAAAAVAAREAVRLAPRDPSYWLYLGGLERKLGRRAEAIVAFKEATRLNPGFAWAHCGLSEVYLEQTQYPEAIAAAREAIKSDPSFANAHGVLGIALRATGDVEGGRAALAEAACLDPRGWEPRFRELFPPPQLAPLPREK